jgi:hypothetical protein
VSGKAIRADPSPEPRKTPIPAGEVEQRATVKRKSLRESVLSSGIEQHVKNSAQQAMLKGFRLPGMASDDKDVMHRMAYEPPKGATASGSQSRAEAMWDRAHDKHLSPAQEAELEYVRNMIRSLEASLEKYRAAEKEIMVHGKHGVAPKP